MFFRRDVHPRVGFTRRRRRPLRTITSLFVSVRRCENRKNRKRIGVFPKCTADSETVKRQSETSPRDRDICIGRVTRRRRNDMNYLRFASRRRGGARCARERRRRRR